MIRAESDSERRVVPCPEPSRRRAALTNVVFGLSQLGLITATGVLLVPVYLRHMSLALYGAWLASGNLIGLLTVFDSGIAIVLTQRLAGALGRGDVSEYARTATTGCFLVGAIGVGIAGAGVALSGSIPGWFKISGAEAQALTRGLILAAIAGGISTVSQTLGALPQACQRTLGMGAVNLTSGIFWVVATLAGIFAGIGVTALGLGLLVKAVLQGAGYLALIAYHWRVMRLPPPRWSSSTARSLSRQTAPVFLARVGNGVGQNCESAIAAALISPAAAAVLAITGRLPLVARSAVSLIDMAVFAGVSSIHGTGDAERTTAVARKLLSLSAALLGLAVGVTIALNRPVVSLWVGADKYGGDAATLLIAIAAGVSMRNGLLFNLLQAMGNFATTSSLELLEALLRVLLMLACGRALGMPGIVLGGLLGSLVKAGLLSRLFAGSLSLRRETALHLLTAGGWGTLTSIAVGVAWHALAPRPTTWGSLLTQGAACVGSMLAPALAVAICRDRALRRR